MPTRSRTTFKKRQKELARMEKQRDKAARRLQRKLEPSSNASMDESETPEGGEAIETSDAAETTPGSSSPTGGV